MGATFVGFGLGSIQIGLFLYEAQQTGVFDRYVVAEVDGAVVRAVREAGGRLSVNIAHADHVEQAELTDIEVFEPGTPGDRREILRAIVEAEEMATAIPSVDLYRAGGDASIARLLADALAPSIQPKLLYTAENHNLAAEKLSRAVSSVGGDLGGCQALNTVIGKMSGYVGSAQEAASVGLVPVVVGGDRAILVESFNRILISRVASTQVRRLITAFEEKDDLLPFEQAKLYGHNAVHAVLGYLAAERGYRRMSEVAAADELMKTAERAFLEECGPALISEHTDLGDPLFSPAGWLEYSRDLLQRMTNPYLRDPVERVCRDPVRKLGWDDRLVGAMRLVLARGGEPRVLGRGVRAALRYAQPHTTLDGAAIRDILSSIWGPGVAGDEARECLRWIVKDDPR